MDNSSDLLAKLGDRYEVLSRIRVGGMGAIYKVRHRLLDEVRIVKAVRHPEASGKAAERFLGEARAVTRLHHPNIAMVHDFALGSGGQAYIVMEHIEGWNLFEVLRGYGPPPLPLTLEIAHQTLKALGYLHRLELVHLDISPDNLMLTRDLDGNPLVKLIDLGLARFLGESSTGATPRTFAGKPRYGSPERLNGDPWDERSDLYSFGVVLYELLTGCCPVAGTETDVLVTGHLTLPPRDFAQTDPGGRVPEDLREIVLKTLAKNPEHRVASAEELLWQLTMIQDRFPLTARKTEELWRALRPPLPAPRKAAFAALETTSVPTVAEGVLRFVEPAARSLSSETRATFRPVPATLEPEPPEPPSDESEAWASHPLRTSSPSQEGLAPTPAEGALAARPGRRLWAALAGMALVAWLPSGWSGWPPGEPEPAALPPVAQERRQAPAVETPSLADHPPAVEPVMTEEPAPAAPPPRPAHPPKVAKASSLPPMRAGDMILRSHPNVEPPELKLLPAYSYPASALGTGRKVLLRVGLLVNENGEVLETRLLEGDVSGDGFVEEAVQAARNAQFFPPLRDGIPGKMWTELLFDFADGQAQ